MDLVEANVYNKSISINSSINYVLDNDDKYGKIMNRFEDVFSGKLCLYNKRTVSLKLKEGATSKYCKPWPIPYALRKKVEEKLDRLVRDKIFEKVESSDWVTPVVPILKSDLKMRLCGDYKITVNPILEINRLPIPIISYFY